MSEQMRSRDAALETRMEQVARKIVDTALYRLDLLVENRVIVEVKAVERVMPVHEAKLPTYLQLSGLRLGFLMNFNTALLKHEMRRVIL